MTERQDLLTLLSKEPFFRHLKPHHYESLLKSAALVEFEAGDYLLKQNGHADRFFIVLEGSVALRTHGVRREELPIQTLHEHDALGLSWLFPPYKWHFDARALEPVRAIAIDATALREAMEADHDLGYVLLKQLVNVMAQRLQATRIQALDIYGKSR